MAAPTFYILHGSDSLRLEEEVARMRQQMSDTPNADLNISDFDGEQTSAAEVLNAASSFPFLADKRLVIVKDMLAHITRKGAGESGKQAVERLENELPTLPDWARLVFVERQPLPDTHKIIKLARSSPAGYEKAFNAPKDTTDWIIKRARDAYDTAIDPRAAQALASVTGDDLRRADNELVKLVTYITGEDRPIREEDVAALTPYVAEANIFAMVDAITTGRGDVALTLLHRLLDDDPRDEGFGIYGMIVRQFRLLLLAKEHLLVYGSRAGLPEALGVKKFPADKAADQCRNFSLDDLEMIYRTLQDYDLKMKTGRISPRLALDLLIAGIAR